jgi:crotonobetaine/carnitine-CoA ligase
MAASSPFRNAPLRGLPPAQQTAPALLTRQAERFGDRPFVRAPGGVTRTYGEMRDAAARAAATLRDAGVTAGDRVAILCPNRIELLDVILGCAWSGAAAVPINTALRGAQLAHVLANSEARLFVIDPAIAGALEHVERPPRLEHVRVLDSASSELPERWAGARLAPACDELPAGTVDPGDTMVILYTSGTTGAAKGVRCPHAQLYWWGVINSEVLSLSADDVLFTSLPLFHTNAINSFFQALVAGATYAIEPRFSASRYWSMARDHGATVTYLLGAMIGMLQAQSESPADREHTVRLALAPATPAPLHKPFRARFGVALVDGYGSTETSHIIGRPDDEQRPGFLGRAVNDFEVNVVDEHDLAVAAGVPGELVVRGRHPFSLATGYHAMPEATVAAWRNLWFHTGDQVVRDEDGWFRFLDRRQDTIRRRGENVSSVEVERVLLEHPGVDAAAVFPVASELAEDEVMAAIVPARGAQLLPAELMAHCEPRLAYFAIPRYVELVSTLPLTENGKVTKRPLRERGVTAATWDRERAGYRLRR